VTTCAKQDVASKRKLINVFVKIRIAVLSFFHNHFLRSNWQRRQKENAASDKGPELHGVPLRGVKVPL
jgi:hypothetical protein